MVAINPNRSAIKINKLNLLIKTETVRLDFLFRPAVWYI